MTSPRRNDPCPCGSGKKYKRCCINTQAPLPPLAPWLSRGGAVLEQLARAEGEVAVNYCREVYESVRAFLGGSTNATFSVAARRAFLARIPNAVDSQGLNQFLESDDFREQFEHFFALDFRLASGSTPLESFAAQQPLPANSMFVRTLRALGHSQVRVYRFIGDGTEAEPTFETILPATSEKLQLTGLRDPAKLRPGALLAMRLAPVFARHILLDTPVVLTDAGVEDLRQHSPDADSLSPVVIALKASDILTAPAPSPRAQREGRREEVLDFSELFDPRTGLAYPVLAKDLQRLFYQGRVALRATALEALGKPPTDLLPCRRRPNGRACPGQLTAQVQRLSPDAGPMSRVNWTCPECGDHGAICEWEGSPLDAVSTACFPRELPSELHLDQGACPIYMLSKTELAMLQRRARLGPLALALLLYAHGPVLKGGTFVICGPPEAFVELARGAMIEILHPKEDAAKDAYWELTERLCRFTAIPSRLTWPRIMAEVLIDQARLHGPNLPLPSDAPHFQLKVTLEGLTPPIRRCLSVPAAISLEDLHALLQIAMGWTRSHLHDFQHQGHRLGAPHFDTDASIALRKIRLDSILHEPGDTLTYIYDFGDEWRHTIELVKPQSPAHKLTLIDGTRACPPEDTGGPDGYSRLLALHQDPAHPDHESAAESLGLTFNPERCELEATRNSIERLAAAWSEAQLAST